MKGARSWALLLLAGALLVVGLPLAGKWARRHDGPRCELDGLKIEPLYRVRVVDAGGADHLFCCVRCARRWAERQADSPRAVYVTDEAGGREVEAGAAYFVQSLVVTNPVTGNRVHAFRDRADADAHARAFRGAVLTGEERPFR
jgi:hypothetical protein